MVLARACNTEAELESGTENQLKPLIYPLIQVTIGAIKSVISSFALDCWSLTTASRLIPTSRYYPLHLQLNRSLVHLIQHTHTYVSLAPFLVPIISSSISPASLKSKGSLRPLDMTLHIRAPAQYLKTPVYAESICEEAIFLFGSWIECVQGSIAFPEIIFPSIVTLKRSLKKSYSPGKHNANSKIVAMVKVFLERIEEGVKWVSRRRDSIDFAPANQPEVEKWERGLNIGDSPIGKYMRVQRKTRERKQALLNKVSSKCPMSWVRPHIDRMFDPRKARHGDNEILEED
jgi:nucleolar complex protein 2